MNRRLGSPTLPPQRSLPRSITIEVQLVYQRLSVADSIRLLCIERGNSDEATLEFHLEATRLSLLSRSYKRCPMSGEPIQSQSAFSALKEDRGSESERTCTTLSAGYGFKMSQGISGSTLFASTSPTMWKRDTKFP